MYMFTKKASGSFLSIILSVGFLHLFACTKGNDPGPGLTINDVSQSRNTVESVMKFRVTLSTASSRDVSVDYTMQEGTAKTPVDFISAGGTLKIPASQTEAFITVTLPADPTDLRQLNLQFKVTLSNPIDCTIAKASATGTIITENGTNLLTDNSGHTSPLTYPGYTLVWSDEFSGNSLDTKVWNYEIGNGSGGWGNNELESYTDNTKNSFLSNGNLIIEARRESSGSFNYTSARLTTQNKKVFKFGRIDIRAKLPVGVGIWPALWMLGSNITSVDWPACGEIDIMELIGIKPSTVYGTLHWANSNGVHASKGSNFQLVSGDYSKEFHVFSLVWGENFLQWFVDDQKFLDISISDVGQTNYPFNANQFLIFNVAVGGNWPGSPDNSTVFPERMFVDYVRVFQ
jgi:beta-glucanase (GH16 family)